MTADFELAQIGEDLIFPSPHLALDEPNGLLAFGGDLSIDRLLLAYKNGIFPWYSEGEPVLWWSPNPRCVIFPEQIHISKSLQKTLKKNDFSATFDITFDTAFEEVIDACSSVRIGQSAEEQNQTWITGEMKDAYINLHIAGHAHSVECWQGKKLVGGMYGIAIGQCFFGESMFSRVSNASKVALIALAKFCQQNDFKLIDCQVSSPHLFTLGAVEIPRQQFLALLEQELLEKDTTTQDSKHGSQQRSQHWKQTYSSRDLLPNNNL